MNKPNRSNAQMCAINCSNELFRTFLRSRLRQPGIRDDLDGEEWLAVQTPEHAAHAVRFLLNIESRRELNTDPIPMQRWDIMQGEFYVWKRGGDV